MYIRKQFISAGYKILVSLLAASAASMLFVVYGVDAWRLFSTWSMLLIAVYFFLAGIIIAISKKREAGKVPCVMLQGMCITASATLVLMECLSFAGLLTVPGVGGFGIAFINFIVPVFVLFDWILFSKKGFWHVIDPWYWLAWIVCYFTIMTLTANYLPKSTLLLYPYEFLNYPEIGLDEMAWWIAIFISLELAFGYLILCLDLLIGGRLSKYIVLPKIKTIIIEEDIPLMVVDENEIEKTEQKPPEYKSQKIEPVVKTDPPRVRKVAPKAGTSRKRTITITPPVEEVVKNQKDAQLQKPDEKKTVSKSTNELTETSAPQSSAAAKNNTPIIRKEALRQKAKTEQARQKVAAQDIDKDLQHKDVKNEDPEALVVEEVTVREVKEVIMGKAPESIDGEKINGEVSQGESK